MIKGDFSIMEETVNKVVKEAVERIQKMEKILDLATQKMNDLEMMAAEYFAFQSEIQRLEAYYTSDDWKEDFALDEEGKLPAGLKRGVLSEDGIYNILEQNKEFVMKLKGLLS